MSLDGSDRDAVLACARLRDGEVGGHLTRVQPDHLGGEADVEDWIVGHVANLLFYSIGKDLRGLCDHLLNLFGREGHGLGCCGWGAELSEEDVDAPFGGQTEDI